MNRDMYIYMYMYMYLYMYMYMYIHKYCPNLVVVASEVISVPLQYCGDSDLYGHTHMHV